MGLFRGGFKFFCVDALVEEFDGFNKIGKSESFRGGCIEGLNTGDGEGVVYTNGDFGFSDDEGIGLEERPV